MTAPDFSAPSEGETVRPYYDEGGVTIYHGDCLGIMPSLSFDLMFTSPPYNLRGSPWKGITGGHGPKSRGKWAVGAGSTGIDYDNHNDSMPWDEYVAWQRAVLSTAWGSLDDDGAIFYNHKPRLVNKRLWTPTELLPPDLSRMLRQIVIWARAGGLNYNRTAYVPTHEWIMVIAKPDWRLRDRAASGAGDVWHVAQTRDPDHPAPFPVALPATAIQTAVPRRVCDPFMGVGTTLVAAMAAGIPAVGIEKSERYCEIAANRLAQGVLAQ